MRHNNLPLSILTVEDVMTEHVLTLDQDLPLRDAAHRLRAAHVTGAPVVDTKGRCVGVLSATDFLRRADADEETNTGRVRVPVCVCSDWQMVERECQHADIVRHQMHTNVVLVRPELSVAELAHRKLSARAHRAVVVEEGNRPVGVVSATDVLAAVAFAGGCTEEFEDEIHCAV